LRLCRRRDRGLAGRLGDDGIESAALAGVTSPFKKEQIPLLFMVACTLGLGFWSVSDVYADPLNRLPTTQFTSGHLFAVSLARAEFRLHSFIPDHTALVGWPAGAAYNPIMWPMVALAMVFEPVVAVWMTFALTPVVNALCAVVLARKFGLNPLAQAVSGGLIAWNPWVRETLANGQLEQAWPGVVALLWTGALATKQATTGAAWRVPLLSVGAAACGASFPHLAVGGAVGLGVMMLAEATLTDRRWGKVTVVLLAVAGGLLAAGAWHAAGYNAAINAFAPKGSTGNPSSLDGLPETAVLSAFFVPPSPPTTSSGVLHCVWLGWAMPLAAMVGLGLNRRKMAPFALAGLALIVLALGAQIGAIPLPYALLAKLSDTLARSGSAYRMVGAAGVALAIVAASGVRRSWLGAVLVGAAWLETLHFGTRPLPYVGRQIDRDPVVAELNAHEGSVLDLPLGSKLCDAGHYAQQATRRQRPVSVITSGVPYSTTRGLVRRFAVAESQPDCGAALRDLVAREGYRSVVLHDHGCRVSDKLRSCLKAAFGAGATVPYSNAPDEDRSISWWNL
jgi:hypothetical protein